MNAPAIQNAIQWTDVRESLWTLGYGRLGTILSPEECGRLRGLYMRDVLFRSTIDMARYRFGQGEYKYFAYPLPALVQELRESLYSQLAPLAIEWMAALSIPTDFPANLSDWLITCHADGQKRPTPLLLRYQAGDYNCLHQDLYGQMAFPFQVITCLSKPDNEFSGGELLLVGQRPRSQSVGHVIRLEQGEAVVITTRYRPVKGTRGYYRTNFRHGVSRLLSGERYTLGIVFHDAA